MVDLLGKVDFYDAPSTKGGHKGFLRASPTKFKLEADGKLIHQMLEACKSTPERKPLNKTELQRARLYNVSFLSEQGEKTVPVSIPEKEPSKGGPSETNPTIEDKATTRHTEFQHFLATLGADLGYDVWIARNDRSRMWRQAVLGELPRVVSTMPLQFNDATTKTIELIDLLWLKGNSIVAAFEIECTTSVYSGLLRMSDLLALQPNLEIRLFLVAPDERRNKVQQEITRPTFSLRDKPLCEICGFLSFDNLAEKVKNIRDMGLIASLRPEFLESVAEYFRSSAGGR